MNFQSIESMPLAPIAQQMIRKVEELSGRLVHLDEGPELRGTKYMVIGSHHLQPKPAYHRPPPALI